MTTLSPIVSSSNSKEKDISISIPTQTFGSNGSVDSSFNSIIHDLYPSTIFNNLMKKNKLEMTITLLCEALHVIFVFSFYDFVKVNIGGGERGLNEGYAHALRVIQIEQSLGAFFEASLQQIFLPFNLFLKFWNLYYVFGHFAVTIGCILFLAWRFPIQYQKFRSIFFWMNIVGVCFYAIYPLMPPRLVAFDCIQKPCPNFGFIDTLADERYSIFVNPTKSNSANSYAAMPSMHIAWALCVGLIGLYPLVNKGWIKFLAALYPICMVFCIIITANHFWLDAIGGLVTFLVTYSFYQFVPKEFQIGHGSYLGHENDHYASWASIIIACGIIILNPSLLMKLIATVFCSFFIYYCASMKIIPFVYTKEKSLPL